MISGTFMIKNKYGLHARPASVFVLKAIEFSSQIQLGKSDESIFVNGKSITKVLTLGISCQDKVILRCQGSDEKVAFAELSKLLSQEILE